MVEPFTGTADQQAMQTVLWSVGIRAATGDRRRPEEAMHKTIVRVIRHNEKVANIMMHEDSRRKTVFSVEDKQFGDDIHRAIEFAEALVGISHA
jgi:hypothetical protein